MSIVFALFGFIVATTCFPRGTARLDYRRGEIQDVLEEVERILGDLTELRASSDIKKWLKEANESLRKISHENYIAAWNYESNITEENAKKKSDVSLKYVNVIKDLAKEAKKHLKALGHYKDYPNWKDDRRQLQLFARDVSCNETDKNKKLDEVQSKLTEIYAKGQVTDSSGKTLELEPDLEEILASSRNTTELVWAWKSWRDVSGKRMKSLFAEMIKLQNDCAVENGYTDSSEVWMEGDFDERSGIEEQVDALWVQVKPLYDQLHAFVRKRLEDFYKNQSVEFSGGKIPAHLLGNMWAQEWQNIFPIVQPFKDVLEVDYDSVLQRKHYDAKTMFETAENFYSSIGLFNMTDTFWKKSIIMKPTDRDIVCHASAWDFFAPDDFRIKMCTNITMEYMETIHHEMGHIEYFMAYQNQPAIFRRGANGGFHEAIGDTIALSVRTRNHLHKIGLLEADINSNDQNKQRKIDINYLMRRALYKVAFLPFGYLLDKYRWKVFKGEITEENYNSEYWKLRQKYQGISAPVPRSEEDFDPGAKFHVAASVPYIRYFISFIAQFQFYEAMCKESGHVGNLYECDFYQSKEAGRKFKEMLQMGGSKPWGDAMECLTGQRKVKADSIIKYFKPLTDWLKEQNGNDVGWTID